METPGDDEKRAALNMKSPKWATEERTHERSENRSARVAALYILRERGTMPDVPKTDIARALGISRWTLDRDLSTVAQIDGHIEQILATVADIPKD